MTRAPICAKCRKPIRRGQHVSTHTFARYIGIDENRVLFEPWLTVVTHLREECMGVSADTVRAVLAAKKKGRPRQFLVTAQPREKTEAAE